AADLRSEREKRRALETELSELKQTLVKSDNQKVIALATKIEQLNTQQAMINERCNVLHKKAVAGGDTEAYAVKMKMKKSVSLFADSKDHWMSIANLKA
ncbi:hypothetical protein ANCDUO_06499, partial [Ancylostoma duodenale]